MYATDRLVSCEGICEIRRWAFAHRVTVDEPDLFATQAKLRLLLIQMRGWDV